MILIFKMEENMQHFWHIMLYYFKKDRNATEMQKKKKDLCSDGEGAVTDQMTKACGQENDFFLQDIHSSVNLFICQTCV